MTPDFIKLWFGQHLFMLNMSIFNLLPYYLELRGVGPDLYGQVAGSMGISIVICMVLFARRADIWSRKTTIGVYFIASLAGNIVALWAMSQPDPRWYFVARLLQGVFMALGFPLIFTWAVELSPPDRKHVVLAWFGIAGLLSNSLGPSLAEWVLSLQPNPNSPDAFFPVFVMSTGFQVASLFFFIWVRDTRAKRVEGEDSIGMRPLLARPHSLLLLLVTASFGGMFGIIMSFGKNYVVSVGLDYVSVLLWAYTIGAIFSRVFIQQISRYVEERHIVMLGLAGLGLTFLMLINTGAYTMLAATGFLYGLSHGVLYPTLFVRFLNFQKSSETGRAATLFQGTFSIGWGLLPLAGGTIVRLTSFNALFGMLVVLSLVGVALAVWAESAATKWKEPRGARD